MKRNRNRTRVLRICGTIMVFMMVCFAQTGLSNWERITELGKYQTFLVHGTMRFQDAQGIVLDVQYIRVETGCIILEQIEGEPSYKDGFIPLGEEIFLNDKATPYLGSEQASYAILNCQKDRIKINLFREPVFTSPLLE